MIQVILEFITVNLHYHLLIPKTVQKKKIHLTKPSIVVTERHFKVAFYLIYDKALILNYRLKYLISGKQAFL